MVHHSHRYKVPTSVERKTRLFPLCQDEKSVLFNTGVYPTLRKLIQPLIDIVIKDKLTENDRKKAKKVINDCLTLTNNLRFLLNCTNVLKRMIPNYYLNLHRNILKDGKLTEKCGEN